MIEIFIPILWICVNTHCEFMQAKTYFLHEEQCRSSLERQKEHMRELVKEAEQNATITVMEGTCVDASIRARIEQST